MQPNGEVAFLTVEAEAGHGTEVNTSQVEFQLGFGMEGGEKFPVAFMAGDGHSRAGGQRQEVKNTGG